ncbi:MAG: hypothetical protein J0M17_21855 [Planctomycetes bacterium]|nr:hypothetical protein [Planctomycetota bacterium]
MPVGQLRFIVPERSRLTDRAVQQAYLTGFDPIPSFCRARFADNGDLLVEREGFDSVKLNIPYRIDGRGEPLTATGTLAQRERPYLLPLELARGKLNVLRNQIAEWEQAGFETSPELRGLIHTATRHLTDAAVRQNEPKVAVMFAHESLVDTLEAAELAARIYTQQALAVRHRSVAKLPIAFGSSLGRQPLEKGLMKLAQAVCNTAVVPLSWKQVVPNEDEYQWEAYAEQLDWCRTLGINTCAGPLIKLDDRGFPAWLNAWQQDVDAIAAFAAEYTAKVVTQFRGRVSFWNCASFSYRQHQLGLRDEEKLRIISRVVETIRRIDADTPLIACFDQPWGEYLRKVPMAYAPIHIADHLVRSGLPIAALGLEIEVGYLPDGTYLRDSLELSRLIDTWSLLGVPLYIFLAAPSAESDDARVDSKAVPVEGAWPGGWTPEGQADWVRAVVPMLLAKPSVQGIAWQQFRDDEPHELPHAGLFDAAGRPKPVLSALTTLRGEHLL